MNEMLLDGDEDELANEWASLTSSSSSSSSANKFYTPFRSHNLISNVFGMLTTSQQSATYVQLNKGPQVSR